MFSVIVLTLLTGLVVLNVVLLTRVRSHESFEARLRDDLSRAQQRQSEESRALREEVATSIQRFASQTEQRTESLRTAVTHQLSGSREEANELLTRFLTATTDMQRDQQKQLEAIRGVIDQRLLSLQTDNAAKLETDAANGRRKASDHA